MDLMNLLSEKKSFILKRWFEEIVEDYPSDSSNFLKKQKDRFANPVGCTISQGIEDLFDELLHDIYSDKCISKLDDIIRVKAVQDFTPSRAVSFIFLLKKIIREEMGDDIKKNHLSDEFQSFESNIDRIALLSFDIYMKCREKIFEIRVNEVRNMTNRLLKMANLVYDIDEQRPDNEPEIFKKENIKG
ncbi:MAG: RsbRD N-terminal domain-containing protein [Nitrospirae bacterium]|jgi:hypothetical protein|nr:RsbRD N-terminal domain-containing protein [Nitrospirota bacterium]